MSIYKATLRANRPQYLGGGQWILENLNHITVLFGKEWLGQERVAAVAAGYRSQWFHYASPERGGDLVHEAGLMNEELSGENRGNRRTANLSQTFRQEAVSRYQAMLVRMGQLAGTTGEAPVSLTHFEDALRELAPDFVFQQGESPSLIIRRRQDNSQIGNASALSSGEAEVISLALDVLTVCKIWILENREPRVLLLDEPDTHLHPDLQQRLGRFLISLSRSENVQFIVATHSTTLLSSLGFYGGADTSVIYLNNSEQAQRAVPFSEHLQDLATCLGGHALMGPLFSAPLLLVEGDDDVQIWSQVPRHHSVRLAVIPCSGKDEEKKYQRLLEKLFACLHPAGGEPLGLALLDGDQNLPAAQEYPQQFVRFMRLGCRESENLYLTDEVLAVLGTNWPNAQVMITEKAPTFGQKEAALLEVVGSDRKNVDYKGLMAQLVQILDPKQVPWTMRVAKTIGTSRPTGQLADFLGVDLLNAIWPQPAVAAAG